MYDYTLKCSRVPALECQGLHFPYMVESVNVIQTTAAFS